MFVPLQWADHLEVKFADKWVSASLPAPDLSCLGLFSRKSRLGANGFCFMGPVWEGLCFPSLGLNASGATQVHRGTLCLDAIQGFRLKLL